MASYPTRELQEEFLSAIRKTQETLIEGVRTWVDTVQSMTPKVPMVPMPFAEQLPRPEQVVASTYDFAEQLLASQRQFAEEWVRTMAPLVPSSVGGDQKAESETGWRSAGDGG
jgi:hypothetical protein